MDIYIEQTNNPAILKFIAPSVITPMGVEFSSAQEATNSPLAQKLFQFPFIKKVIISTNIVAIEKADEVSWEDVANDLKILINEFYQNNQIIVTEEKKQEPFSLYAEMTPNPNAMKFVSNKILCDGIVEYKTPQEAKPGTLAANIFSLPFVKEVFISENYISINKADTVDWNDVAIETRNFLLEYLRSGQPLFLPGEVLISQAQGQGDKKSHFSETETKIKEILEEYVKPAVANDGGNIELVEFVEETKTAVMLLQGACSGCPSSTMTLKNGIENILKEMLPNVVNKVEAING